MPRNFNFRFGPLFEATDRTCFRLWAPGAEKAHLRLNGAHEFEMTPTAYGWHEIRAACGAGAQYSFCVGDLVVPDPASRMQSADVHGPSVVTDCSTYQWRCNGWSGRPWKETILYELHPGLLGGFAGIQMHLPRLADLGVTAIELMPIADFPGARNWGYDGVLPFAPDRAYGTPDELKALVDNAHGHGLMVFLDVVYNHFGPEGNYLPVYAPEFFDDSKRTPWGAAINFSQSEVRRFFIENAIYWLLEFRFDGLRFDAAHAICDKSYLPELAREIRTNVVGRDIHLVLENDANDAELLNEGFDAQWDDDLHHVLHVLLTGESRGYYEEYKVDPAAKLARALSEGFVHQGDLPRPRDGESRGTPTDGLCAPSFVFFLQNHDQIGNRAFGERLTLLADPKTLEAAIALQLLAPEIPLIFMGEECGAKEPFLYFAAHRDPELAKAVRDGRRREFATFPEFAGNCDRSRIPDPNAPETFERSRPSFENNERSALYKRLLQLRHEYLVPRLAGIKCDGAEVLGDKALLAKWHFQNGGQLIIAINLGSDSVTANLPTAKPIWGEPTERTEIPAATTLVWVSES